MGIDSNANGEVTLGKSVFFHAADPIENPVSYSKSTILSFLIVNMNGREKV